MQAAFPPVFPLVLVSRFHPFCCHGCRWRTKQMLLSKKTHTTPPSWLESFRHAQVPDGVCLHSLPPQKNTPCLLLQSLLVPQPFPCHPQHAKVFNRQACEGIGMRGAQRLLMISILYAREVWVLYWYVREGAGAVVRASGSVCVGTHASNAGRRRRKERLGGACPPLQSLPGRADSMLMLEKQPLFAPAFLNSQPLQIILIFSFPDRLFCTAGPNWAAFLLLWRIAPQGEKFIWHSPRGLGCRKFLLG